MSLKSTIAPYVSRWITSPDRLQRQRRKFERKRLRQGKPHQVEYFHQVDDPYSCLMVQLLPALAHAFDIEIICHLVDPPPDWAAPERQRLVEYARKDATRLAVKSGLWFQDRGLQPDDSALAEAGNALAELIAQGSFVEKAGERCIALWQQKSDAPSSRPVMPSAQFRTLIEQGTVRRRRLGHYLGGMLYYAGEWYWGPDRIGHLTDRLASLNTMTANVTAPPVFMPPSVPAHQGNADTDYPEIHFYLSFRSPYTYIATQRIKALADAYNTRLEMRFVLPMMMRGLPVPAMKRRYIVSDVAREARRLSVPFGSINDPLGKPVERGYSLLPWAREKGRDFEYSLSFMRAVWAEGVDAGSDKGMRHIVENAGLTWSEAQPILGNDDWQTEAEENRQEMMDLGLWGVPSFRVGDTCAWGQDRLWVIEDFLATR